MYSGSLENSILLVGAPNSGKTTLYNWMTGASFKTANYPGSTVDFNIGNLLEKYSEELQVVDTPGIYSLCPKTPEEEVTKNILINDLSQSQSSVSVVVVIDINQLERQLVLVDQLKEAGLDIVVALTMTDTLSGEVNVSEIESAINFPVVVVDNKLGGNLEGLLEAASKQKKSYEDLKTVEWGEAEYKKAYGKYDGLLEKATSEETRKAQDKITHQLDKIFLHPVLGLVSFFAVMTLIFSSVFWISQPAIDFVDGIFASLAEWVISFNESSLFFQFLGEGFIAGIGAFAVFVPQIAILFFGITFLENSGYLARAATIIDKPLSLFGLNGRSFVPILSSFACALPGMMAARTIPNKKEKFLTLFILPLMTCSARLPVYALLLAFLFKGQPSWVPGIILTVIYFLSALLGGITSAIVSRFLPKSKDSFFILELPTYKWPNLKTVARNVWLKTYSFVRNAGPIILVLSLFIWLGSTFPNYDAESESEKLATSYMGKAGKVIEPAFEPMGVDWRVGVGMLSAFAAREVFVSALAVMFKVEADDDDVRDRSLLGKMSEARFINSDGSEGELIFNFASVIAIIIFFMIALQCMATVGLAVREFGSWRMALFQLISFNLGAYILAVLAFQLLS